jgi:hypothetical protein
MRSTIPILLTGLASALLFAGCGSKGTTTSTTSTADWAGSVCTAITTWKTSVNSAVDSVKSGTISKSSLQDAADQVKSADQTFADTVKGLGKPNTRAGSQAKQSLDQLSTDITTEQQKISTAIDGVTSVTGLLAAAPTVLDSLKTMATEVSTTFKQLQTLDASGELSSAFDQASACQTLKKSSQ